MDPASASQLGDNIASFLAEARAYLDQSVMGASPSTPKYTHLAAADAVASKEELSRATSLLKEALKEWNRERQAHQQTKELLRLALEELRDGRAPLNGRTVLDDEGRRLPHPAMSTPSMRDVSKVHASGPSGEQQQQFYNVTHSGQRPIQAADLASPGIASPNSKLLQAMLFQAAPSFASPVGQGQYSPGRLRRGQTPPRTTSGAASQAHRATTPPFQSSAPRFRDVIPAGDQLLYGTSSGNARGLHYKTTADAQRMLRGRGDGLTTSALHARHAIGQLHQRLTTATPPRGVGNTISSTPRRAQTDTTATEGGPTTLFSPL